MFQPPPPFLLSFFDVCRFWCGLNFQGTRVELLPCHKSILPFRACQVYEVKVRDLQQLCSAAVRFLGDHLFLKSRYKAVTWTWRQIFRGALFLGKFFKHQWHFPVFPYFSVVLNGILQLLLEFFLKYPMKDISGSLSEPFAGRHTTAYSSS